MALPNPGMDFTPFDVLTAEELDDIVENIESLADGTGFEAGAIGTSTLAPGAVTPDKLALGEQFARVDTTQTTSSTSYTDLSTVGPAVTATVGPSGKVLISFSSNINIATSGGIAYLSFAASGSTTIAASDANGVLFQAPTTSHNSSLSKCFVLTGLTPGSNTFTLKYKTFSSSVNFFVRNISVVPL